MGDNVVITPAAAQLDAHYVYHHYAKDYYDYFKNYPNNRPPFSPVPYTLLLHSIELEIKSALLRSGMSKQEVANKKHKLDEAYDALNPEAKVLNPEEVKVLRKSAPFANTQDFKYFLPMTAVRRGYMPELTKLDHIAVKLISSGDKAYSSESA